jgi:hypothetical protein
MKPYILIIEDDADIAGIRCNLEREGTFGAQIALAGEEARLAFSKPPKRSPEGIDKAPDLIIL